MEFVPLAKLHVLDEGLPVSARARGEEFLLIRQSGRIRIFNARCPHAGQSLLRGTIASGAIRCPGHGLRFDLSDGHCLEQSRCAALQAYKPVFMGNAVGIDWP